MSQQSQIHLHHRSKGPSRQSYHSFHTQRQQTITHSLHPCNNHTLSNSRELLTSSIDFHINNPIRQLLYEFREMLKSKDFKSIEIFQNQLYLVRMTTLDKLKKLFACLQPPKYLLSIKTQQYRSVRTSTSQKSSSTMSEAQELLKYLQSSKKLSKPPKTDQSNELQSEYKQDIYSLDATSTYMFSRMLVDRNYSIGKRVGLIVERIKEVKNLEDLKFTDVVWVNKAIGEVTEEMLEGFNCSRKELYEILGYCRKSIENYFYRSMEQNALETSDSLGEKDQILPEKYVSLRPEQKSVRNQSFFVIFYPVSIRQLKNLLNSIISVQIFLQTFILIHFIKIESQNNKIQEDLRNEFLDWLKEYSGDKILAKFRCLRGAGFSEKSLQSFVKELRFQE